MCRDRETLSRCRRAGGGDTGGTPWKLPVEATVGANGGHALKGALPFNFFLKPLIYSGSYFPYLGSSLMLVSRTKLS